MYTKVFRQIYDGTLADNWQALVTFQQMLILADQYGVVDMTIAAIHRTTGIPEEILAAGIKALEAPDLGSRTPDMEGRRIVRLDEHREWGWFLVNFEKYRKQVSREDKKEADRLRIADKRAEKKSNVISSVASCREQSQPVADVAHTDTDTEKRTSPIGEESAAALPAADPCPHTEIIAAYHELLPQLDRVRTWDADRQRLLRSRWRESRERQTLDWWRDFFQYVGRCPFLLGQESSRHRDPFLADLEWLVRPKNFRKVIEGKYEPRRVA